MHFTRTIRHSTLQFCGVLKIRFVSSPHLLRASDPGRRTRRMARVSHPVAWAGTLPAGPIAGVGKLAFAERQATTADALREPGA
jgi:hypothetical protein